MKCAKLLLGHVDRDVATRIVQAFQQHAGLDATAFARIAHQRAGSDAPSDGVHMATEDSEFSAAQVVLVGFADAFEKLRVWASPPCDTSGYPPMCLRTIRLGRLADGRAKPAGPSAHTGGGSFPWGVRYS